MPTRITSDDEFRRIRREGIGFIYNDNWGSLHKAGCHTLNQARLYTGPEAEYHPPGSKYFDEDRAALVAWANAWLAAYQEPLSFCETCQP